MEDEGAHRASLLAFLAETGGLGATLIKHTHAHRALRADWEGGYDHTRMC